MIHVTGRPRADNPPLEEEEELGFILDPDKKADWTRIFRERSRDRAYSPLPNAAEVEAAY